MDSELEALLEGPALAPPPGVKPNFSYPPNLKAIAMGVPIACVIISTLAIFMRMFVKCYLLRRFHLEDWIMMTAWLCYVGQSAVYFITLIAYPNVHQWDVPLKRLSEFLWRLYVGKIIWSIVIALVKVAILIQIVRVFVPRGQRTTLFWTGRVLIGINIIFYVLYVFLTIFACSPIKKAYDPLASGKCLDTLFNDAATAAFNILSDITILAAPQAVIWRLKISFTKRIGLSLFCFIGLFATAFAAVRLYAMIRVQQTGDLTYWGGLTCLFAYPELASGFLVLCAPVLPRFIKSLSASSRSILSTSKESRKTDKRSWTELSPANDGPTQRSDSSRELVGSKSDQPVEQEQRVGTGITKTVHIRSLESSRVEDLDGTPFRTPFLWGENEEGWQA